MGKGNDPNCGIGQAMLAADTGIAPHEAFSPGPGLRKCPHFDPEHGTVSTEVQPTLDRMLLAVAQMESAPLPRRRLLSWLRRSAHGDEVTPARTLAEACADTVKDAPYSVDVVESDGDMRVVLRDGANVVDTSDPIPEEEFLRAIELVRQWKARASSKNVELCRAVQARASIDKLDATLRARHEAALAQLPGRPGYDYRRFRVKVYRSDLRHDTRIFISMFETSDRVRNGDYAFEASEHGPWGDEVQGKLATFDDLAYAAARWEREAMRRTATHAVAWAAGQLEEHQAERERRHRARVAQDTARTVRSQALGLQENS